MLFAVPPALENEDESTALAELLALLGVSAWLVGLVWLAVHLVARASHHGRDRRP